jgi:transmembrane sensor
MSARAPGQLDDQAAYWVARMDGDGWSSEAEADLQAWLAGDPQRAGALLRSHASWAMLDRDPFDCEADDAIEAPTPWKRRSFLAGGGAAIAASLLGGVLWLNASTSYSTQLGEIRRVPLRDGSVVTINSGSELRVKLGADRRIVRLNEGEAWFQVAKAPERPFVVETGRVVVKAVGTAFSVRRRDHGAEIIVTEGVVEAWASAAEGHLVRLTAGQRAFVADNAAIRAEPAAASEVDRALAWRRGLIILSGEPLETAAEQFNRYNARKIEVVEPSLRSELFDGVFRVDDPSGFAAAVEASLGASVDYSDPEAIKVGRQR